VQEIMKVDLDTTHLVLNLEKTSGLSKPVNLYPVQWKTGDVALVLDCPSFSRDLGSRKQRKHIPQNVGAEEDEGTEKGGRRVEGEDLDL